MTSFTHVLPRLLADLKACRHRRAVVISGSVDWCYQRANEVCERFDAQEVVWASDSDNPSLDSRTFSSLKSLLGSERDLVVFDAHSGFDPDAFGVVAGIIRAGGLLLILAPPLAEWGKFADPQYRRIAVWPHTAEGIRGSFLNRLVKKLQIDSEIIVEQGKPFIHKPSVTSPLATVKSGTGLYATLEQEQVVKGLLKVVSGHRRRPFVITADRGRGKSSALGIAAAQLLKTKGAKVVVTAPNSQAVMAVFEMAEKTLAECGAVTRDNNTLHYGESSLVFIPPDELVRNMAQATMIMVDEAAAIPISLLEPLLKHYSRIAFSTTVHGYEGTGRGFDVRFKSILMSVSPQCSCMVMSEPVRWADGDPLEETVKNVLLLAAEPAVVLSVNSEDIIYCEYSSEELSLDEHKLTQAFGLLVLAHYQTSPLDLRHLLDGPNIRICLATLRGDVVGVAMVAEEGGFDSSLASDIFNGLRRPQGHLLPQTLLAQAGLPDAGVQTYLRIVRLAVLPELQQQGIGSGLVKVVSKWAKEGDFDQVSSSFGLTPELLDFWSSNGFSPVHLGSRKNKGSGEHSVVVSLPESQEGKAFVSQAIEEFESSFPIMLGETFRDLDSSDALKILSQLHKPSMIFSERDEQVLEGYAQHKRSYESSSVVLMEAAIYQLCARPADNAMTLVVEKILQRRSWSEVAKTSGLSGRKSCENTLRARISELKLF